VALAAALKADVCEIYTDVDGIFTADPRVATNARHIAQITYEEMLELAACGAKRNIPPPGTEADEFLYMRGVTAMTCGR